MYQAGVMAANALLMQVGHTFLFPGPVVLPGDGLLAAGFIPPSYMYTTTHTTREVTGKTL